MYLSYVCVCVYIHLHVFVYLHMKAWVRVYVHLHMWVSKKLDGNYTRMLQAILNKSWKQHPMKKQLYGHLAPISKANKIRQTRYVEHCWRSKDKFISDILQWTHTHGHGSVGQPARTYLHQFCVDTGCNLELPGAMDDRDGWRERESQGNLCCLHDLMTMMMYMSLYMCVEIDKEKTHTMITFYLMVK